ncbi:MAG TPA: HD domain-containing phosphohydrolase [Gemmatimonadaceae bacterium]|nr:HD domain-containing phosphohydrolase [Gemmatimonadaceae bacterium]
MNSRLSIALGASAAAALIQHQRRSRNALERFAAAALETLLNAIEANDQDTGMHVRRVAAMSLIIADAAGFDARQQKCIERVALFHDIGKIHEALFDIVHEGTRLTPAQRRLIDTHPRRGAEVLAPLEPFYPELTNGVLSHHECWNGSGYPRRLRGKRIPIEARVVAIADTFDAITHSRSYRGAAGVEHAIEVLAAGRGTQFDPELLDLALLPPVIERMTRVHLAYTKTRSGRRARRREAVPDVSFRWRSESLGSRRIRATG